LSADALAIGGAVAATTAAHRRARWSTRVLFAALGLLGGIWGAHIPSVKVQHGLSEFSLSMVLLAGAFGSISALFFAGRLVAGLGARRAVIVAGWLMCAMFSLLLVLPGLWAVLPAAFLFGCGMSVFDVSINSEGSELESVTGRPIMSNLHGMFSVGAMSGATLSSALLHAGVAPALQLGAAAAVLAIVMALASTGMLEVHASAAEGDKAHFAWPRGLLLLIGLLIFTGMIAEGVMNDWCVLYLKQEQGMPQAQAALGYSAFAGAMALARFGGDSLRARYSERSILFASASLAAVSMAVVLLVGVPWVSMVGFALVGAGVAPVAPILFNAATRVPGVSRAAAIASVTSIGYSGFMVGPPLIGSIAQATSLTVALAAVVVGAVCLAIGSRKVPLAATPPR
jgi:fucose permease